MTATWVPKRRASSRPLVAPRTPDEWERGWQRTWKKLGFLPYELLRDFQWRGLAAAVGGPAAYAALAVWVFAAGLRRYESGSGFHVRL